MADNPCALRATAPAHAGELLQRRGSDDRLPHQSIVFVDGERTRVLDPADARRVVDVPDDVSEAILLPTRLVAVRDRRELVTAPASGKPLTSLRGGDGGDGLRGIDATGDGRGGIAVVGCQGSRIFVDRVDVAGKLAAHHADLLGDTRFVRVARTTHGFALAWVVIKPVEPRESILAAALVDDDGKLVGKTMRVDTAPGEQMYVDLAIAPAGDGVVLAWNPFGPAPDKSDAVPVDLRVFRVDTAGAKALRHVPSTTQSWAVAGSAGGLLPNGLQAVTIGGRAVLVWTDYANDKPQCRGLVVDGGAPVALGGPWRGLPLVRSRGNDAVGLVERENGFDELIISCGASK